MKFIFVSLLFVLATWAGAAESPKISLFSPQGPVKAPRQARASFSAPQVALAPHVAARLLPAHEQSTLDRDLQMFVTERLRSQVLSERSHNMHEAAAVVLDNRTGETLAYVGGIGKLSSARFVDGVRAPRQAGSTLKPFLYAYALDKHYLTAASRLEDTPADFPVAGGMYRPRNFDNEFHGKDVPLRVALASSLNVPAVRTLALIGVEPVVEKLGQLGFAHLRGAEDYGPSLALGSADVTLWDLTNAYRALANGGSFTDARLTADAGPQPRRRVYSAQATFIISDILSDRESRSLTFGLENPLSSSFWTAVKTGTSKDMRDNWCIGYSERYTVGVWAGNFSGEPMWNVSGISGAAPVWAAVMKWLHRGVPSHAPSAPSGVVWSGTSRLRGEWFVSGTEPSVAPGSAPDSPDSASAQAARVRITYPAENMMIALDPDIPVDRQKVFFGASSPSADWKWALNGKEISREETAWTPRIAGNYLLELKDARGARLDAVKFSVRGSGAKNKDGG